MMRGNDIGLAALESARNAEQAYNVRIIGVEVLTLTMNQKRSRLRSIVGMYRAFVLYILTLSIFVASSPKSFTCPKT